jgi:hypothetical protein
MKQTKGFLKQPLYNVEIFNNYSYAMMSRGCGWMDSDEDSDSDDDFMNSDYYELLCQGIKPWDPEAGAALAVLNGWF